MRLNVSVDAEQTNIAKFVLGGPVHQRDREYNLAFMKTQGTFYASCWRKEVEGWVGSIPVCWISVIISCPGW